MFGKRTPAPGSDFLRARVRALSAAHTPAPSSAPPPKPRAPRDPKFRNASLIFDDGHRLSVTIKDLSVGGARIEYFIRVTLPLEVVISEPTLRLRRRARVAWQRDGVAGLAFVP